MTGLEFLSATIGQLVWPIVVVVLVLLLKEPIKKIAASPRLTRVKVGPSGLEAEFKQELDEVERELESGPAENEVEPPANVEAAGSDFRLEMERLAAVAPRSVVLESFVRLESFLRNSIDVPDGERGPRFVPMRTLGRIAVEQGLLTSNEASVLDELTYLRNRVAHEADETLSQEAAIRYAEAVWDVAVAAHLAQGKTHRDGPPL